METTVKARCSLKVEQGEGSNRYTRCTFTADYVDSEGNRINEDWALATPYFSAEMLLNERAADYFEAGKSYTLTFSEE